MNKLRCAMLTGLLLAGTAGIAMAQVNPGFGSSAAGGSGGTPTGPTNPDYGFGSSAGAGAGGTPTPPLSGYGFGSSTAAGPGGVPTGPTSPNVPMLGTRAPPAEVAPPRFYGTVARAVPHEHRRAARTRARSSHGAQRR